MCVGLLEIHVRCALKEKRSKHELDGNTVLVLVLFRSVTYPQRSHWVSCLFVYVLDASHGIFPDELCKVVSEPTLFSIQLKSMGAVLLNLHDSLRILSFMGLKLLSGVPEILFDDLGLKRYLQFLFLHRYDQTPWYSAASLLALPCIALHCLLCWLVLSSVKSRRRNRRK
jgi:hypothetical protein